MDISELFKLHSRLFGEEQTLSLVAKVDESFLAKQVNGLAGRGHDTREQMRTSNTRFVGKISSLTKCSARVSMSRGANKSVFFPAGFVSTLINSLVSDLHGRKSELSDTQRDYLFSVDLGL